MSLLARSSSIPSCRWAPRRTSWCRPLGRLCRRRALRLIALGFVLIFKASGVFNFAQGIMMVFAALTWSACTRRAFRPSSPFADLRRDVRAGARRRAHRAATARQSARHHPLHGDFRPHLFLVGFGELLFGGNPKTMITDQLCCRAAPSISRSWAASSRCRSSMSPLRSSPRHGRRARLLLPEDPHRSRAARRRRRSPGGLSVGISLDQIWVIVWFTAGLVALGTGIMWGARSDVSFALQMVALKALPVLILGGLTSIPGAIVGGLIIGIGEKLGEFYWGPSSAAASRAGSPMSSRWPFCCSGPKASSAKRSSSGSDQSLRHSPGGNA